MAESGVDYRCIYADRFAGLAPMASGIDDVLFPFVEKPVAHSRVCHSWARGSGDAGATES